ncbi:MAG: U32 family peptidase [Clostridiaceae bacterium]|nr:U32 family peptidase [Clostridiaceae bacterium]
MELLSPAGSFDAVRAAVQNGADAVYFGGASFNARRKAKNLTDTELAAAIAYCHRFGVRVYCTFNILVSDREMREADEAAAALARCGADALIVQDVGLARRLRKVVPDMPLHASTQMSVHNVEGARIAAELGFSRVVAARELSREDLEILCRESPIPVEVFAHGALCAAYSGQCYMSAMIGRRSGNRGLCAQPCRMLYDDGDGHAYPAMSLKELCMAGKLRELSDMGVASLKIEGRMRRPEYAALATAVYRRTLDTGKAPSKEELSRLGMLFSREGFTDGYYTGRAVSRTGAPGRPMFGIRTEASEEEMTRLCAAVRKTYASDTREEKKLVQKPPVIGVYTPEKSLPNRKSRPKLTVSVQSFDQITPGLLRCAPAQVYLPLETAAADPARVRGLLEREVPVAVTLPRVILPTQEREIAAMLRVAAESGVQTALVGNLGHAKLSADAGMTLRGDYGLNAYNTHALTVLRELGFASATASFELRFAAIRDMGKALPVEAIVYGRLPLMLFENCLIRSREGECRCEKPRTLRDRTGEEFLLLPAYGCRTELFNGVPLWLADRREDYAKLGLGAARLVFTTETPAECVRVAECYLHGGEPPERFTRGLYYRGVE